MPVIICIHTLSKTYFLLLALEFSFRILSNIFGSRLREKIRGELRGLSHRSLDFHFTLYKSHLRIEFSKADLFEVRISHGEKSIILFSGAFLTTSTSVFKINFPGFYDFSSFFLSYVKLEDSCDFLH